MRTVSNYSLRLPASLKKEAERIAAEDNSTLNQFIVTAVAEKVSALRTADYFAERRARGSLELFDKIMSRKIGEPPIPEDEIPPEYKARKHG